MLARYGSLPQQRRWLVPLLRGEIRSAFAMTEPGVASSDATNIQGSIVRSGGSYVLNGRWAAQRAAPFRHGVVGVLTGVGAGACLRHS